MNDCNLELAKASNCPGSMWKDLIVVLLSRPHMRMVDMGSNKGYNVNNFLLRYQSGWNVTNAMYFDFQSPYLEHAECGTCGACKEEPSVSLRRANVNFWAIELTRQTYRPLYKALMHFNAPGHVVHAAVSDVLGRAYAPQHVQPGRENILMSETKGRRVRKITVDHLLRYEVGEIDLLSVDTEGNDAKVLQGAQNLIKSKKHHRTPFFSPIYSYCKYTHEFTLAFLRLHSLPTRILERRRFVRVFPTGHGAHPPRCALV